MVHWTSITNITAQGCCKLTWLAMQTDQIITQATVFDLLGQGGKRTSSPSLPLQPYNPAATSVVRSMRPASRNPLFPFSNGFRQPHSSSRPSNSSPTSGILGGNPPVSSPLFNFLHSLQCALRYLQILEGLEGKHVFSQILISDSNHQICVLYMKFISLWITK